MTCSQILGENLIKLLRFQDTNAQSRHKFGITLVATYAGKLHSMFEFRIARISRTASNTIGFTAIELYHHRTSLPSSFYYHRTSLQHELVDANATRSLGAYGNLGALSVMPTWPDNQVARRTANRKKNKSQRWPDQKVKKLNECWSLFYVCVELHDRMVSVLMNRRGSLDHIRSEPHARTSIFERWLTVAIVITIDAKAIVQQCWTRKITFQDHPVWSSSTIY